MKKKVVDESLSEEDLLLHDLEFMLPEEFMLTMYHASGFCDSLSYVFEELLPPNTFALFQTYPICYFKHIPDAINELINSCQLAGWTDIISPSEMVGIKFNVKEPIVKGDYDSWNQEMELDQAAVLNNSLEIDHEGKYDYRIDLPNNLLPHFGLASENINEVRCKLEGDWVKLFLANAKVSPPPPPGTILYTNGYFLFSPDVLKISKILASRYRSRYTSTVKM